MPKKKRDRIERVLVPVYRFGQSPESHTTGLFIPLDVANLWYMDGCGMVLGERGNRYFLICRVERTKQTDERDRTREIDKPVGPLPNSRLKAMQSGVAMIWAYLNGNREAIALVNSFWPSRTV